MSYKRMSRIEGHMESLLKNQLNNRKKKTIMEALGWRSTPPHRQSQVNAGAQILQIKPPKIEFLEFYGENPLT